MKRSDPAERRRKRLRAVERRVKVAFNSPWLGRPGVCLASCPPLSFLPMEGWAGAAPHSPLIPLSSARLIDSAESTEMGIISVPQTHPHPAETGYCFGAEVEGTNLCVPGASQGWREWPSTQTWQHDKPWGGLVVMGKVAQASGIQGALLVHGMGKCC